MSWFRSLLARLGTPDAEPDSSRTMRLDDASYDAHGDILEGMEFAATLRIQTPLSVLLHHGEIFRGPPTEAPQYGTRADGIWVFKPRSFRELGIDIDELEESTHASDIGPIKPSQYLPFLVQFRTIIESNLSREEKRSQLRSMQSRSRQFEQLWEKLSVSYGNFTDRFLLDP